MNTAIPHLQDILNTIDISLLPYQKGNKIYIGKACIKKHRNTYKIFRNKKFIGQSFTKLAALILAKNQNVELATLENVKQLDHQVEKNFHDCVFYKNVVKSSKDDKQKAVLECRYDVSVDKINIAVNKLSNILFSN